MLVSSPNDLRASYFPLAIAQAGVLCALLGARFPRPWNTLMGAVAGWAGARWFVAYETTWDFVPMSISALGAAMGGLLGLAVSPVMRGLVLGYSSAILVVVAFGNTFFAPNDFDATILFIFLCALGTAVGLLHPTSSLIAATSISGAFATFAYIDVYGDAKFHDLATMFTLFTNPGAHLAVECGESCHVSLACWVAAAAAAAGAQLLLLRVAPIEESSSGYDKAAVGSSPGRNPHVKGYVWASMGPRGGTRTRATGLKRAELSYGRLVPLTSGSGARWEAENPLGSRGCDVASQNDIRAAFNYLPRVRMPPGMQRLDMLLLDIFSRLEGVFGFQPSSTRNQREHLLWLVTNTSQRLGGSGLNKSSVESKGSGRDRGAGRLQAVSQVHEKLFGNYRKWCAHLGIIDALGVPPSRDATRARLENAALFLLVWGEAASLRHCPESLCFLFHSMLRELRGRGGGGVLGSDDDDVGDDGGVDLPRSPGDFLKFVIRPVYELFRQDRRDIHTGRRNYDDVNEFFWSKTCLGYAYCEPGYLRSDASRRRGEEGSKERPTLREGLRGAGKTYAETRSWLHVVKTFFPVIQFLVVSFHILVCTSLVLHQGGAESNFYLDTDHGSDNALMLSFVVTYGCMSILRELTVLAVDAPRLRRPSERLGSGLRVAVKAGLTLAIVFYLRRVWTCEGIRCASDWFMFLALTLVFLAPALLQILCVLFPALGRLGSSMCCTPPRRLRTVIAAWWPDSDLYVGKDMAEKDGDYFRYQVFWILLITWKMLISYNFQIKTCVRPSLRIWARGDLGPGASCALLLVLWAPFFMVFMFDIYIWYAVWQSVAGLVVGMRNRIGQIHDFGQVTAVFCDIVDELGKVMFRQSPRGDAQIRSKQGVASAATSPLTVVITPPEQGPAGPSAATTATDSLQLDSKAFPTYGSMDDGSMTEGGASSGDQNAGGDVEMQALARDPTPPPADRWSNNQRFAVIWNEMVGDLRRADKLSNREVELFEFQWEDIRDCIPRSKAQYRLPLFVSAPAVSAALSLITSKSAEMHSRGFPGGGDRAADGLASGRRREPRAVAEVAAFHRDRTAATAVGELWTLTVALVRAVAPIPRNSPRRVRRTPDPRLDIDAITRILRKVMLLPPGGGAASGTSAGAASTRGIFNLFRTVDLSTLATTVKAKLLSFVRSMRLARAKWKPDLPDQKVARASGGGVATNGTTTHAPSTAAASAVDPIATDTAATDDNGAAGLRVVGRGIGWDRRHGSRLRASGGRPLHKVNSMPTLVLQEWLDNQENGAKDLLADEPDTPKLDPALAKMVALLKDQLLGFLRALRPVLAPARSETAGTPSADSKLLASHLDSLLGSVERDFGRTRAHIEALSHLFASDQCRLTLSSMYTFLTVSDEFTPRNSDAKRRILFFCNSLFMQLPEAPPVERMRSLTTLTPFYSEDVIYSKAYLKNRTKEGFSILLYLQIVYPKEWENFCERVGVKGADASILDWANPSIQRQVRLWATRRGQTLFRTVDGMMLYDKAIKVLLELEGRPPEVAGRLRDAVVGGWGGSDMGGADAKEAAVGKARALSPQALRCLKYQYVVSCQVYGKQKEEQNPKAKDIEFLLQQYPNLRVAYIDNVKFESKETGKRESRYYSCLIKAREEQPSPRGRSSNPYSTNGRGKSAARVEAEADDNMDDDDPMGRASEPVIETVYRVELPGNPIIGEGKPENQNHAIIFTRGEFIQAIDMNQEGYFEEAVKMRNLLEEFGKADSRKPTTILGFREHIFTGGLSSVANYMAMQEGCFVTMGQRVLHDPLKTRLHYGHPDVFDKLFFLSRGGISKASKGINLSEDIFAGFNAVLRGGHVNFKEYIQVGKGRDVGLQQLYLFEGKLACGNAMQALTRDMYRLLAKLDFLKLLSFFYGGIGFYLSTMLAVWTLYVFCYQRMLMAVFEVAQKHSFVGIDTVGYWIGTMGILLTLPICVSLGLERGVGRALSKVAHMFVSGGPLFFMFHMGTKAHFFARTILAGGAKYRPTGRGFVADHTRFAELFRFYQVSHFSGASEMAALLILYGIFDTRVGHYWAVTWCAWLVVVSWLFAPLWLNPKAFEWDELVKDTEDFLKWMARPEGGSSLSWKTWWLEECSYVDNLHASSRVMLALLSLRHLVPALCIFGFCNVGIFSPITLFCIALMGVMLVFHSLNSRRLRADQMCFYRGFKAIYASLVALAAIFILVVYTPTARDVRTAALVLAGLVYIIATVTSLCLCMGNRATRLTPIRQLCRLVDYAIGLLLLGVVFVLSLLSVPSWVQTHLLFHNAFSKGVLIDELLRGRREEPRAIGADTTREQQQQQQQRQQQRQRSPRELRARAGSRGGRPPRAGRPPVVPPARQRQGGSAARENPGSRGAVMGRGAGPAVLPVDTSLVSKTHR